MAFATGPAGFWKLRCRATGHVVAFAVAYADASIASAIGDDGAMMRQAESSIIADAVCQTPRRRS